MLLLRIFNQLSPISRTSEGEKLPCGEQFPRTAIGKIRKDAVDPQFQKVGHVSGTIHRPDMDAQLCLMCRSDKPRSDDAPAWVDCDRANFARNGNEPPTL